MALKFLNKKGWHTGSLRNIENVWKAEQKHEAEQKKLEELRKQIHEERERAEFRQLQEQAGLIPKQERLDFLYDSGLAVGKGGSGFKALESLPKADPETTASSSSTANQQSAVPGALFEEKPQSANDAWRKLHSDPLLMIRQREQEALSRVKNNPIQMAMIRKSVEAKVATSKDEKKRKKKHHRKKSKHHKHSSSENESDSEDDALKVEMQREGHHKGSNSDKQREGHHKGSNSDKPSRKAAYTSHEESNLVNARRKSYNDKEHEFQRHSSASHPYPKYDKGDDKRRSKKSRYGSQHEEYSSERHVESHHDKRSHAGSFDKPPRNDSNNGRRSVAKLSEEERAERLREMQMDAELHEEQRWKRLKRAADSDAQEAIHDRASQGRNFLDAAQRSVYGAEKGGSSTIEESVRRRTHYLQGRSATDSNAFRRS